MKLFQNDRQPLPFFSLSNTRKLHLLFFVLIFAAAVSFTAFADESSSAASRAENGQTLFYATLNEAFEAAAGTSIDLPDEITLLADCILDSPIIIEEGQHVRLVSEKDEKTIHRGRTNLENPLFWVKGNNASLSLGKETMQGGIIVDGAYLNSPPVEAKAPLAAASGQYAKLIMYNNVTLQNNYNAGDAQGTDVYRNGAGVFLRTYEGSPENQVEFIMKGGIIRGNSNNTTLAAPAGGGVAITGIALFTMEGGIIMNNTAYLCGGGFHTGSRGSFKKTGGIVYGEDAPEGYRNTAINGYSDPKLYGHALSIALVGIPRLRYRNDTVGEDDDLSYIGSPIEDGVFGEGEQWDNYTEESWKRVTIILPSVMLLAAVGFFLITSRKRRMKALSTERITNAGIKLSSREKEIFDMLLTDASIKEIAYTLKLSYSGVNFHIKNIYNKLGVQSRTELLITFKK